MKRNEGCLTGRTCCDLQSGLWECLCESEDGCVVLQGEIEGELIIRPVNVIVFAAKCADLNILSGQKCGRFFVCVFFLNKHEQKCLFNKYNDLKKISLGK